MTAEVQITRKGEKRWRAGHPWIFRSDVVAPEPDQAPAPGALVRVRGGRSKLGWAAWSSTSLMAVRRVPLPDDLDPEAGWLALVDAAIERRTGRGTTTRLINGDPDGLPGLVVDRYGPGISIQALSQTAFQRLDAVVARLVDRFAPQVVVLRNDVKVTRHEELAYEKRLLLGDDPQVEAPIGRLSIAFDLMEGQKTGGFLDQTDNRLAAARFLSGDVLDCFSYDGGFSLQLAARGAQVTAVDVSEPALERLRCNAERNGLAIRTVGANVFDQLRAFEAEGRQFDGIVLDPPAFCPNRKAVPAGRRAYKEINLRALKLLKPGGRLVSWTCSAHMTRPDFEAVVAEAAADARRWTRVVERRSAAPDHPSLLTAPETDYLKGLHLQVD
ncbi:MAG: class I SAM-dependent rRNA methyltransferase [Myxococcales bacterium]|nr:class I SAM-dependent rRNA methyltransferase [Myxococcales bacterium]MCB9524943.1 class I SAM-dependent rRNA methyltransferase [Myxococcales bacterium]